MVLVHRENEMMTVCQKCGDRGFPEVLNHCIKCKVIAEHIYCFDVLPKTLDEDVVWTCWFCLSGVADGDDFGGCSSCPAQITSDEAVKAVRKKKWEASDAYLKAMEKSKRVKSSSPSQSGEVEVHKSVSLTYSDEPELDCAGANEEENRSIVCGISSERHQKSNEKDISILEENDGLTVAKEASQNDTSNLPKISGHDSNVNAHSLEKNKSYEQDQSLSEQNLEKVGDGSNEIANYMEKDTSQSNGTGDMPIILDETFNIDAQPILDPVWRGNFAINNENFDTLNGLVAYTSNQASTKVREAASLLPGSVPVKMLPRLEVFPKKFVSSGVTCGDIGLYIFPEKERDEPAFDGLMDSIIGQDLAMKADLEHAELLLFTSLQLPLENWRYRGKYYLWGLFGKKKFSQH